MRFVRLEPEHFLSLRLQPAQKRYYERLLTPENAERLTLSMARTALSGDVVLGCAGFVPFCGLPNEPRRATAWALLSDQILPGDFIIIHNHVRAGLNAMRDLGYQRIETTIDPHFRNAIRWARALGFEITESKEKNPHDGRTMLLAVKNQ